MRIILSLVAVLTMAPGCFATRSDLNLLLEQQKQLALRLSRMQDHLADLTLRVQELRTDVREVRGDMVQVDQAQEPLQQELIKLKERLAGIEQQNRISERVSEYQAERMRADLMTLNTPVQMYEAAVSSYASADTDRALALFGELQRKWPSDKYAVGAKVEQGKIYAAQSMYLEAIDLLLGVIEKHSNSAWAPEAYLTLGSTLFGIEQIETGEQLLNDLIKFFPETPEAASGQALLDEQARLKAEAEAARLAASMPSTAPTEITSLSAVTAAAEVTLSADAVTVPADFTPITAPAAMPDTAATESGL